MQREKPRFLAFAVDLDSGTNALIHDYLEAAGHGEDAPVTIQDASRLLIGEHRELFLSGLHLAMDEAK